MPPAEPRGTERLAARAPDLLLNVALFAAKAGEVWRKPRPLVAPHSEEAKTVHGDLERLAVGIVAARVVSPGAEHLVSPNRIHVGLDPGGMELVVNERPLEHVATVGTGGVHVANESGE